MIERTSLRSKVARQIFVLFLLSSFVPLAVLAYFSFINISQSLREEAVRGLHESCRSTGMTIFERLRFLESDFAEIVERLRQGSSSPAVQEAFKSNKGITGSFLGISLLSGKTQSVIYGPLRNLPSLTDAEMDHLRQGKVLLISREKDDHVDSLLMVKALDPDSVGSALVIGEISPIHIWRGEESMTPLSNLVVIDEDRKILFLSDSALAPLLPRMISSSAGNSSGSFEWSAHGDDNLAGFWTLFMKPRYFTNWTLAQSIDRSAILGPVSDFRRTFFLVSGLTFFIILFLTINQIRKRLVPIETLTAATKRITERDYGSHVSIKSGDEFEALGKSFNMMTESLGNHFRVMDAINKIGITLTAEKDSDRLMRSILTGAQKVTNADGYALYMSKEDGSIQPVTMIIESIDMVFGSSVAPSIPLFNDDAEPNNLNVVVYTALNNRTVNIPDIYDDNNFDFSYIFQFDRQNNYRTKSLLNVPIQDHEDRTIGVLQLINAHSANTGETGPFSEDDRMLIETLASQAGVALSKNRLIENMKELFDALVELISTAIDEKSPYTGGHSRRVADLALMIASAVSRQKEGPFRDTEFSEEELYELKIASLLHDCGKVTTPVHVMDKATRLQAIVDRIHLIDTRFEVLKRDIQMRERSDKEMRESMHAEAIKGQEDCLSRLQQDRDFIRNCNSGERSLTDEDRERILAIGKRYKWITMDGNEEPILTENERHHLSVREGTITPEERDLINEHINLTIRMLKSLPYPESLKNIPVIVATHHERSDGSGYPKGLTGDQIPLQGRILAIADVFEALLAGDRPYKKWKSVSEALHILGEMKDKGQLDPDLFELFMREEVYITYVEKHAPHGLSDKVDHRVIPGYNCS